ncbi:hypothetical protein DFH09DRAFT_1322012 [Mycena vulgaris]|nr:hypothetical protein DFH09DRAFT_1322012 [Mycena vulgaris]
MSRFMNARQAECVLFQNGALDQHIHALGLPPPEALVIGIAEVERWDAFIEVTSDTDLKTAFAHAMADFAFHVGGSLFSADVITKIDRK